MIYSVGYAKLSIEDVERIMETFKLELLIDVRSHPYSRNPMKYEFNKNQMEERLGERYQWKGDILGGRYGAVKPLGLQYLVNLDGRGSRGILLCMEADPVTCHRYYDISVRLLTQGIDVIHLPDAVTTSELVARNRGDLL